jgi:parvulin-like peptidyl-prolyl isomerase
MKNSMPARGLGKSAALCAVLLAAACARSVGFDVVLVVDGYEFKAQRFSDYLYFNTHPDVVHEDWGPGMRDMLFQRFMDEQILLVAAWNELDGERKKREKWAEPGDVSLPAASLLQEEYLQKHLLSRLKVSEEEARSYYRAHTGDYHAVDRAVVRHLRLPDKESLANAMRMLSNGEASFADLSVRFASSQPETQMQTYERGSLPEEFERAVFSLKAGEVSAPVELKGEFYLFELVRMEPAHALSFEQARPRVERALSEQKLDAQMKALIEEKRKSFHVEAYPEHIQYKSPKGRVSS